MALCSDPGAVGIVEELPQSEQHRKGIEPGADARSQTAAALCAYLRRRRRQEAQRVQDIVLLLLTGGFFESRTLAQNNGRPLSEAAGQRQKHPIPTDGALTDMDALDMDARSFPTLVGEVGFARDRPQGDRSWSPPLPPNDRRRQSLANKQILGRAGTTVLEGPAYSNQAT